MVNDPTRLARLAVECEQRLGRTRAALSSMREASEALDRIDGQVAEIEAQLEDASEPAPTRRYLWDGVEQPLSNAERQAVQNQLIPQLARLKLDRVEAQERFRLLKAAWQETDRAWSTYAQMVERCRRHVEAETVELLRQGVRAEEAKNMAIIARPGVGIVPALDDEPAFGYRLPRSVPSAAPVEAVPVSDTGITARPDVGVRTAPARSETNVIKGGRLK